MQIGIHDLDDDDLEVNGGTEVHDNPPAQDEHQDQEDAFMSDFLKTRGIDDINKIKFEDDNDQIVERSWNDLTKEEKFNILNTPLEEQHTDSTQTDLSDEEIELLSRIRQSNLTPSQFIEQIQGQQVVQEPTYKIDDLSDDELYILDLESRVGELSDETLAQALSMAKQNEELYQKQIEGIRKEYKEREDFQIQQEEASREQEQQEAYNRFQDNIINSIDQFDSVGNLNLNFDESDKEELAQFMLSKDEQGNNYLWQALQDPDTLVRAAWFILNGDEALNNISDYFINQIKLVSQNQYKKGLEDGKKGISSRPSVVINNSQKQDQHRSYSRIEDLDDDD